MVTKINHRLAGNHWNLEATGIWKPQEFRNHWTLETTGISIRISINININSIDRPLAANALCKNQCFIRHVSQEKAGNNAKTIECINILLGIHWTLETTGFGNGWNLETNGIWKPLEACTGSTRTPAHWKPLEFGNHWNSEATGI